MEIGSGSALELSGAAVRRDCTRLVPTKSFDHDKVRGIAASLV
jgi:hypothetical protein